MCTFFCTFLCAKNAPLHRSHQCRLHRQTPRRAFRPHLFSPRHRRRFLAHNVAYRMFYRLVPETVSVLYPPARLLLAANRVDPPAQRVYIGIGAAHIAIEFYLPFHQRHEIIFYFFCPLYLFFRSYHFHFLLFFVGAVAPLILSILYVSSIVLSIDNK